MKKAILLVLAASIVHAAIALSVDASNEFRDVTHVGIGTLYGVTEDTPADIEGLVKPLNPYMFTMPARAGNGNQHNNKAGAIPVAERLARAGISSATVTISLADLCPGWPYKFPGWDSWKAQVESVIADKRKSSGRYYGYDIWNEPEGTWQGFSNELVNSDKSLQSWDKREQSFFKLWKDTYDLIREKDPGEKIIGSCEAWYAEGRIKNFLTYCKTNNCLPDIMCWHELGGTAGITNNVNSYRKLETSLGISPPRPISINEYGESYLEEDKPYEGCPGRSAAQIAKMERIGIESASISWWHTQYAGQLSSLLASNTAKGAGWFFYKWYGEMSGKMIMVTPPATNNRNVDGFANIDHDKKFISILFGGENDNSGTVNVTFNKLPSWIGSAAKVKIEKVDWTSRTTVSNGPTTISENERPVTNNSLSVSVTGCNNTSGYRIYITPANVSSSSSSLAISSSSRAASSSSAGTTTCEYRISFCGGLPYSSVLSNSTTMPTVGQCLYIGDFSIIQPHLNSTVAINGLENTFEDEWLAYNERPERKDDGYYVYVKKGKINDNTDNAPEIDGWRGIVAKEKPGCTPLAETPTPIINHSLIATSHSPTYYSLKGEPLGNAKPQKAGIYIVKQGSSVQKIAVR